MTEKNLLIEIGTEELPPKALKDLIQAFKENMSSALTQTGLLFESIESYASPRRLALMVKQLCEQQQDQLIERRGPSFEQAFDTAGKPTPACIGFAKSCQVSVESLEITENEKGRWLYFRKKEPGKLTANLIANLISKSLQNLPIPKMMAWGDSDFMFVRPVHWVVLLYGRLVVPATFFGKKTGRFTQGHRFHHPDPIKLNQADDYIPTLEKLGQVIPSFEIRRQMILEQIQKLASKQKATPIYDAALLDEITSLVEWPVALQASFEERFLVVPPEALISSMQHHQRCIPLKDKQGQLLPHFITVSHIESLNPAVIKNGNERVMRARLSDAKFFYESDCKVLMDEWVDRLKNVAFQKNLGSLYDKTQRVIRLAKKISKNSHEEKTFTRAGYLLKADLMSQMVGEFPELQGIMGEYYARVAKEPTDISITIREHYLPRFAGDALPKTSLGQIYALADRLDTLTGIFGLSQNPTGSKDPFGLRRSAIGIIRILIEGQLPFDLLQSIQEAYAGYDSLPNKNTVQEVHAFVLDRLETYYREKNIPVEILQSVLSRENSDLMNLDKRIVAVQNFVQLPEAKSLVQANKRVVSILEQANFSKFVSELKPNHLIEASEKELADALIVMDGHISVLSKQGDYEATLRALATLQPLVDQFFDRVLVNVPDVSLRNARLTLLSFLRHQFLQVADVAKLASILG